MLKYRITIAVGALLAAAALFPLASSSFGQDKEERGPAWWWNYWEPGSSEAWDLRTMSPQQRQRMMRHWTFMNEEVPEEYREATNDVGYTIKAIEAGGPLYAVYCLKCHGEIGLGNGREAENLTPSPALLAYLVQQPISVDQYLLWSISDGGRRFGTAMPAFKNELSQEQIWQIIAYLRAGFPEIDMAATSGPVRSQKMQAPPPAGTTQPPAEDSEKGPAAKTEE